MSLKSLWKRIVSVVEQDPPVTCGTTKSQDDSKNSPKNKLIRTNLARDFETINMVSDATLELMIRRKRLALSFLLKEQKNRMNK